MAVDRDKYLAVCTLIQVIFQTVIVFTCTYWIIKYNQHKHQEYCKRRHSILVDIALLSALISDLGYLLLRFIHHSKPNSEIKMLDIIQRMIIIPLSLSTFIAIYKYCQHLYGLYYDIQLSKTTQKQKWIELINNKKSNDNWFIKNKNKWGNIKYTNKITLTIIIIQVIWTVMDFHILYSNILL